MDAIRAEIHELLARLGVTRNYKGYGQTACAIELCRNDPKRLLFVTKWVYPEVAKWYKTNCGSVERNIRTVRKVIWERNRPLLEELAHRPLPKMPQSAQLLSILSAEENFGRYMIHEQKNTALPSIDTLESKEILYI